MTGVLCVGIATLDYVYGVEAMPTRAEKHRAHDLSIVGGGLAANAAAAVARLGGACWLAARLGDDPTATTILSELEVDGVDTRFCRRIPGLRSPVSAILVDRAGERMVISYADPAMPPATDWLPSVLPPGVGAVLGDTRWDAGAAVLFSVARRNSLPAVLDGDRAPSNPDVLQLATHVAFSVQGLRDVTGCENPREGLLKFGQTAANWVAVTMGPEGVAYLDKGEIRHIPAFAVTAVDTLGAGDTWHGAFALALAEGQAEPEAIRFASAVAAIKCTRFGGRTGAPGRREVEQFLGERG